MAPELDTDSRAFPCVPPSDLDDPRVIVEHDWAAFRAVEQMTNHWDRPGWSDQRRVYYWMLTHANAPELVRRAEYCQGSLEHLGMDFVPSDGLHVTMPRVGDAELVSMAQIQSLRASAADTFFRGFRVLAHPLAGSRGAVRFSLSPWRPLVRLHTMLRALGEQAGAPGGKPTSVFRPHLGIAYNNRGRSAAPVIEAVSQLRGLPPVELEITSVELVELRRQDNAYRWETVFTLPLQPAAPSSVL
ncbi:2'-5' RNA ligase family protein [Streptomyces mirabilis]|uniref:2'-5' RNA ligase family protein n=1 Tax=Streptomyces mirabilis TaxID=68239 RepID=UPI003EBBE892